MVGNWEPAHSSGKLLSLGPRLQQRLPSDSGRHTPASLPWGVGGCLYAAGWLPFGVRSTLCSVSGRGCTVEPLAPSQESSLPFFFSPSGDPTAWVAISCWLPQIVLGAFRPGPHPKQPLCSPRLPVQLPLTVVEGASELLLCWHLQLGTSLSLLCFFLPIMLPSEILKLPTDPPVRGFPTVWKLLLHDSLPRTGPDP